MSARIGDGARHAVVLVGLAMAVGSHAIPARALPTLVPERAVEFWVVEPNEGDSAGGHAALRIGERLYHVEHRGDGLITDRRTARARFEEIYRARGNRAITQIPLALTPAELDRLEDTLEQRYFERTRRLDALDAQVARSEFLARAHERGHLAIEVPGLGLFETGPSRCAARGSSSIGIVRREIARRHGRDWLFERRALARRLIEARLARIVLPEGTEAPGPGGALRRLREAVQTWVAFEILGGCRGVRIDRIRTVNPDFEAIHAGKGARDQSAGNVTIARTRASASKDAVTVHARPDARARWRKARDEQRARLVRLVASEREDVGLAMLLAQARLEALDRSLASGRLLVLDPQAEGEGPDRASATPDDDVPAAWLPLLEERARERVRIERHAFEQGSGPLEARLAGLEQAVHEARHVAHGRRHRAPAPTSPSASYSIHYVAAERILPWPEGLELARLARARAVSQGRAERLREELAPSLEYRLFTRNCVTELLSVLARLDDSSASPRGSAASVSPEATAADVLRGRFIPVVAGRHVAEHLSSGPAQRLDSAREILVREIDTSQPGQQWREAMTWTARSYRPHAADSSFLLFSDGPVWLRPLTGLANLAYGFGAAGVGVLAAPFDLGRQVRRGLLGAMMSVPELFFFEVRQGSYAVSPPVARFGSGPQRSESGSGARPASRSRSAPRSESSSGSMFTR